VPRLNGAGRLNRLGGSGPGPGATPWRYPDVPPGNTRPVRISSVWRLNGSRARNKFTEPVALSSAGQLSVHQIVNPRLSVGGHGW